MVKVRSSSFGPAYAADRTCKQCIEKAISADSFPACMAYEDEPHHYQRMIPGSYPGNCPQLNELFEDIFGRNLQVVKKAVNYELKKRNKTIQVDPKTGISEVVQK